MSNQQRSIWKVWNWNYDWNYDDDKYFWINRRDLEIELGYKNWAVIFYKFDPKNKNTDQY